MNRSSTGLGVIVCGMPSSGNRIVQRLIRYHNIECIIHHHGTFEEDVRRMQDDGLIVSAIWVTRDEEIHKLSVRRNKILGPDMSYAESQHRHYVDTLDLCARLRMPILPICYEQLVRNPMGLGRWITSWLNQPFRGWPVPVVDGNEKYRGMVGKPDAALPEPGPEERAAADAAYSNQDEEIIGHMSATLTGRGGVRALRKAAEASGGLELAD